MKSSGKSGNTSGQTIYRFENIFCFHDVQSKLCTTTTLGTPKLWPMLTGGRCYIEVAYVDISIEIGPLKRWSLKAGGFYSEVVVRSGLTLM
jgi:hypothetical protein